MRWCRTTRGRLITSAVFPNAGHQRKGLKMKRAMAAALLAGLASFAVIGCNEQKKSSTIHEMKIATPGGTTTITTEREVKMTGDDPPGAMP